MAGSRRFSEQAVSPFLLSPLQQVVSHTHHFFNELLKTSPLNAGAPREIYDYVGPLKPEDRDAIKRQVAAGSPAIEIRIGIEEPILVTPQNLELMLNVLERSAQVDIYRGSADGPILNIVLPRLTRIEPQMNNAVSFDLFVDRRLQFTLRRQMASGAEFTVKDHKGLRKVRSDEYSVLGPFTEHNLLREAFENNSAGRFLYRNDLPPYDSVYLVTFTLGQEDNPIPFGLVYRRKGDTRLYLAQLWDDRRILDAYLTDIVQFLSALGPQYAVPVSDGFHMTSPVIWKPAGSSRSELQETPDGFRLILTPAVAKTTTHPGAPPAVLFFAAIVCASMAAFWPFFILAAWASLALTFVCLQENLPIREPPALKTFFSAFTRETSLSESLQGLFLQTPFLKLLLALSGGLLALEVHAGWRLSIYFVSGLLLFASIAHIAKYLSYFGLGRSQWLNAFWIPRHSTALASPAVMLYTALFAASVAIHDSSYGWLAPIASVFVFGAMWLMQNNMPEPGDRKSMLSALWTGLASTDSTLAAHRSLSLTPLTVLLSGLASIALTVLLPPGGIQTTVFTMAGVQIALAPAIALYMVAMRISAEIETTDSPTPVAALLLPSWVQPIDIPYSPSTVDPLTKPGRLALSLLFVGLAMGVGSIIYYFLVEPQRLLEVWRWFVAVLHRFRVHALFGSMAILAIPFSSQSAPSVWLEKLAA